MSTTRNLGSWVGVVALTLTGALFISWAIGFLTLPSDDWGVQDMGRATYTLMASVCLIIASMFLFPAYRLFRRLIGSLAGSAKTRKPLRWIAITLLVSVAAAVLVSIYAYVLSTGGLFAYDGPLDPDLVSRFQSISGFALAFAFFSAAAGVTIIRQVRQASGNPGTA